MEFCRNFFKYHMVPRKNRRFIPFSPHHMIPLLGSSGHNVGPELSRRVHWTLITWFFLFWVEKMAQKFWPNLWIRPNSRTSYPSQLARICPWSPDNVNYFRLSRENGPKVELRREFRPFRMRRRHFKNCSSPNRTYQAAYPKSGWNDQTGMNHFY